MTQSRFKRVLAVLLCTISLAPLAHAQVAALNPAPVRFPDIPPGFYAEEAVSIAVRSGVIVGRTNGLFDGRANLTRYEAAIIIARLIRLFGEDITAIYNDLDDLRAAIDDLYDLVDGLQDQIDELRARLDDLEPRVAALEDIADDHEARIRALEARQPQVGPPGPPGPQGPSGPAGPAGPPGVMPAPRTSAGPLEGGPVVELPAGLPQGFYVGLAGLSDTFESPIIRTVAGYDGLLIPNVGVRAFLDYGRQSYLDEGTVAVGGHLLYRVGNEGFNGYLGAGGGYQFNPYDCNYAYEGAFVGALVGAEYNFLGNFSAFAELTLDYYLGDEPAIDLYDNPYPLIGAGIMFRL